MELSHLILLLERDRRQRAMESDRVVAMFCDELSESMLRCQTHKTFVKAVTTNMPQMITGVFGHISIFFKCPSINPNF